MSRFSLDDDDREWDELRPNAHCSDCGVEYSKADADPTTWCDACSDRRSRWADALEARMQAKAALSITRKKEIA